MAVYVTLEELDKLFPSKTEPNLELVELQWRWVYLTVETSGQTQEQPRSQVLDW